MVVHSDFKFNSNFTKTYSYPNTIYTVQHVHNICLPLTNIQRPLLYVKRHIIFSYAFRRTSVPSSGALYLAGLFSAHQLAVNTRPDVPVTRGLLTDADNRTVQYGTREDGAAVRRNEQRNVIWRVKILEDIQTIWSCCLYVLCYYHILSYSMYIWLCSCLVL
jgi:hypothetical protein